MTEITVVIPNYNGIKYIGECLEALYAQQEECPQFQVLVVDNGSEDGSLELIEQQYPQTALIRLPENTGFCHAVNCGIRQADTPYVILLNNDTKVKSGFVKALFEAIQGKERVFSVSAQMLMWDKPQLIDDAGDRYCVLGWAYARGKGRPAADYMEPKEVFAACGGAAMYRRDVFEEIGYFDELHFAYLEDMDIGYRAKIFGYKNYYAPGARVLHYGSASTGARYNARKTLLASANSVYIIGKNMPLLQWLWNLPFLLCGFLVKFLFFCCKGMGILYLKGVMAGLKRCCSKDGRYNKVSFRGENIVNYLLIQWELYANMIHFIMKS